jgi:hypothetical protein
VVKAIAGRLRRLEQQRFGPAAREPFRVVINSGVSPLNLAASTCTRTLCPNGVVTEGVTMEGTRQGLSDEELEAFIATFPIERHRA